MRKKGEEVAEPAGKPGSVVDSHSSTAGVAAGLQQPTRVRYEPYHRTPIRTCSGWGLPCHAALAPHAVGSYPTVSPLPRTLPGRSAVCFLLHFPSARAAQALPGTLLCGARTFLGALLRRDCLAGSAARILARRRRRQVRLGAAGGPRFSGSRCPAPRPCALPRRSPALAATSPRRGPRPARPVAPRRESIAAG